MMGRTPPFGDTFDRYRELLGGRRARDWFRGQVDELIQTLTPGSPALADGGQIMPGLHLHIDDTQWQVLVKNFFRCP